MPRKRPTESSWDSDEELLGDTSSVSAFSSKKGGEDEIDEDALLGFGDDNMQEFSEGGEYSFATSEIEIGLDSTTGLDSTAGSQELDYEDIPEETAEEFVLEETPDIDIEDPLMVGEQPNDTTCAVESTEPVEIAEEDSDDEGSKRDRGRFQTERKSTNITSSTKGSTIPDSLEITKEMQEEIDTFEKQKGKLNKRGGGRQQNRGQTRNIRGQGQMRGHNMAHRMQRPVGRLMGPRGTGPNRLRGPQGFQRPMGLPMRQNSQGGPRPQMFRPQGPNQNMNRGPVPRFSNEMIRAPNQGPRPDHSSRKPIPQLFTSSQPVPLQPMYTEQPHITQPVPSHSQPQPQFVHSQPHVMLNQPTGSTIHVNPKFQGGLPTSVQQSSQHSVLPHSVPQPLFSQQQPMQSYQNSQQAWGNQHHPGQQPSMHSSAPGSYPQSQQMYPPQPQPVPLLPEHQNRPGILGSHPAGLMQAPDHQHHQEHSMHPQNAHQMQPRPLLQPQHHHPNQQHLNVRNTGPTHNFNQHGPRNHLGGPQQVRPQRPMANQNIRGPRPANQMSGNVRPMRPAGGQNFKPRNPQTNQRFKVAEKSGATQNLKQNATSGQHAGPEKVEVDPEKEKKLKEMEEKKRLRAERFKMNTPVQVNAGSPSNKKIIATKAGKRPSGDEPSKDEISPAKSIKIETLATMKTDSSAMNSEDALKKALEEQKKRRELIMKIKEAKRQAVAEQKRKALAEKLAKEGKSSADQPVETQQDSQAHHQQHQQQFNAQNRGRGRGQKFNRGRGQGHVNVGSQGQGQPISVLGQKQPNLVQVPIEEDHAIAQGFNQGQSRGQGQARGRGFVKGQGHSRGRGVHSAPNIVNLQQVEIQENALFDNGLNRSVSEPSNNRTVLTNSSTRQVIGMNPRGAASQASSAQGRAVIEENPAPRRIVLNSYEPLQSSTVLIKDLPAKVDLGKINKKCSQHGNIKSFNYKADAKQIIVQYHSPAEAATFLKKNPKFMIDMAYLTSSSLPDETD